MPLAKGLPEELIPIYGTVQQSRALARDWDELSTREKIRGVGFAGLSAVGDVALIAPPVGVAVKALKGGKMIQTLRVTKADEAVGIAKTTQATGQKAAIKVTAVGSQREIAQVQKLVKGLGHDPVTLKNTPSITLTTEPTRRGAQSLIRTDDAIQAAAKDIPKGAKRRLDRITNAEIVVSSSIPKKELAAIANKLGSSKVKRLTVVSVKRPKVNATDVDLRALAKHQAKARGLGETPDQLAKKMAAALATSSNRVVSKSANNLAKALENQGIRVSEEIMDLAKLKHLKGRRKLRREISLEPRAASGGGVRGGGPGGIALKTKAPPGVAGRLGTTVRTEKGRFLIVASPGLLSVQPASGQTPAEFQRVLAPARGPKKAEFAAPSKRAKAEPGVGPEPQARATVQVAPGVSPAAAQRTATQTRGQLAAGSPVATTTLKATTTKKAAPAFVPRFRLPDGTFLPSGVYPREVTWPQGQVQVTMDLATGKKVFRRRTSKQRVKAREGFKVVSTSKARPVDREFRHGFVNINVRPTRLTFRRRRGGP